MLNPAAPVGGAPYRGHGAWTFFREWLKSPLTIASIVPSSRYLARRMMAALPAGTHTVIEIGAGTGVFTQALLDRGIAPDRLLVVERNEELYEILRQRFPGVRVAFGDAAELPAIIESTGFTDSGAVDAVISSLGFRSMPKDLQLSILRSIAAVLAPAAPMVQFTYGWTCSVAHDVLEQVKMHGDRVSFTLRNFPPAGVFVYRAKK